MYHVFPCISNHLQADVKVQFRRSFRVQVLDLFLGVVAPWDENHHEKNTIWEICLVNKSKLQIDSYQSTGTYLWSIHVSKNPFVIVFSEIRKDFFKLCNFFKCYFNMTLLLHGFHPMRKHSTAKIRGICGTSSFSGRRSTLGEPRDMPCLPKK